MKRLETFPFPWILLAVAGNALLLTVVIGHYAMAPHPDGVDRDLGPYALRVPLVLEGGRIEPISASDTLSVPGAETVSGTLNVGNSSGTTLNLTAASTGTTDGVVEMMNNHTASRLFGYYYDGSSTFIFRDFASSADLIKFVAGAGVDFPAQVTNESTTTLQNTVITNGLTITSIVCNGTGSSDCIAGGTYCNDISGAFTPNSGATSCTLTLVRSVNTPGPSCTFSGGGPVTARSVSSITFNVGSGVVDYWCNGH